MVTKRPSGKSSSSILLRRVSTSPGPEPMVASERNMPRVADIRRAAAGSLAGDIGQYEAPAPLGKRNKVVPIAANRAGGKRQSGDHEARDERRRARQKRLLNGARLFGFARHLLALLLFEMKDAGVLHGDGDMRAESLEKAELGLAEGVEVVIDRKSTRLNSSH